MVLYPCHTDTAKKHHLETQLSPEWCEMFFFFAFFFYCRYLISQGANVGGVNSEGETPLDIAEEEAMEELLQNEINRQGTFTPGAHSVAQMLSKHSKTLRR